MTDIEELDLPSGEHTALPKDLPEEIPAHLQHTHNAESSHYYARNDVKTLLAWKAPGRPFKKKTKEFYLNGLLIIVLVEIIALLFHQYLLMLVVLSLAFVTFALRTVPPHAFHYRISTEGITVEDHCFLWQELYDFYFKRRDGVDILHIRTYAFIPGELTLTLGDVHREHIKSILLPYLPFREVIKPTFMEKSADWLYKNFPLEKASNKVAS